MTSRAVNQLRQDYPWTLTPLVSSAPMRVICTAPIAVAVSQAGGLGFIGAGTDTTTLSADLDEAEKLLAQGTQLNLTSPWKNDTSYLPIGVGFITWAAELQSAVTILSSHPPPAALWLFAPKDNPDHEIWCRELRRATNNISKVWTQIGSVAEALEVCLSCNPDVLVVQGIDAGGHGLQHGASIISLLPEVHDALESALAQGKISRMPVLIATGGIADGRGAAAALALGASGVVMGTRYLCSPEAVLAKGYQEEVLRATDGGQSTVRSRVYDTLRGTSGWPERYGGRGVINASYEDWMAGRMAREENERLYSEALKMGDAGWGPSGRMTTYAGTGIGLVRRVMPAGDITAEVREDCERIMRAMSSSRL